jgi:glutathionyl-hydroquinone reductase
VNNGVYRCGFARTQDAYDEAYHALFARLDWLSERLATRRYLVGDTIDFGQTKEHYHKVHTSLNPSKIVPDGPDLSGWVTPHHREQLGGRPFGDGTPPGPPPPAERVAADRT